MGPGAVLRSRADSVLNFQPARELRLDMSEFVYSFASGIWNSRSHPEDCSRDGRTGAAVVQISLVET